MIFFEQSLHAGGGFSNVGYSARAIGLGGAFVPLSGNAYSLFYNPAGISDIKSLNLSSLYLRLYPNIEDDNLNYYSISGAVPFQPIGIFGIGFTMFTANFWSENVLYGSYAREVISNLSVGGSLKLLRWSASAAPGESALSYFGITADAGARYVFKDFIESNDLHFGIAIRNINQPSIAKNGSSDAKLPIGFDFGIAYVSNTYNYLITSSFQKEGNDQKLHFGAEILGIKSKVYDLDFKLIFRGGGESIISNGKQGQLNGGFGISIDNFTLDYTYVYHFEMINISGNHVISLNYSF